MTDIIPQDGRLTALLEAGYQLTYTQAADGAWFADLRYADGRCAEAGCGATQEMARGHLAERLGRDGNRIAALLADGPQRLARRERDVADLDSTVERCDFFGERLDKLEDQVEKLLVLEDLVYMLDERTNPGEGKETLDGALARLLGEGSSVTFGRDAANGSYFADVTTTAGRDLYGTGESPAAALRDAEYAEDEPDMQPYCKTCGEPVSIFHGHEGWRHFRGEGTPESRTELYDAGHPVAVAWREPAAESAL